MKHEVEKTLRVNVPADKIWEVLGDFSSVEQYASTIKSSPIVGDIKSGLGARRLNTFLDGTSLIEEITDYHEGKGFKMKLSEYSFPLKYMNSEVGVKSIDEKSCELSMSTDFVVKAGPLGWLMGYFMVRPMMKGVFEKQMSCLAYHSMTGKRIDEELPSSDELAKIMIS
jgi:Polyketide cyclase / dehydrase and lipid transport